MVYHNESVFETAFTLVKLNVVNGDDFKWMLSSNGVKWCLLLHVRLFVDDTLTFLLNEVLNIVTHSRPVKPSLSSPIF